MVPEMGANLTTLTVGLTKNLSDGVDAFFPSPAGVTPSQEKARRGLSTFLMSHVWIPSPREPPPVTTCILFMLMSTESPQIYMLFICWTSVSVRTSQNLIWRSHPPL